MWRPGYTGLSASTIRCASVIPSCPQAPSRRPVSSHRPRADGVRVPGPCASGLPEQPASAPQSEPASTGSARPIGIAGLMVVEQDIQRYELGEIAHIENVLRSEFKERKHRRAQTTEESTFLETERSEQTERDLQTSERFELQTESQQTIRQDSSKDVGVSGSASYGPVGDVTITTNFATSSAQEESNRSATTYARRDIARGESHSAARPGTTLAANG